jgi:predicted transcriptional regulator
MNNLSAEMARYGVSILDIESILGCTERTVRNKLNGVTEFSIGEAFALRDTFFPNMRLEYLFASAREESKH